MQVFDLTQLRDAGPLPQIFTAATVYRGADDEGLEVSNAHNIAINEETGYAYIVGSNTCVSAGAGGENGGLHMVDISDPEQPEFAGCARVTDTPSNNYSHDVQCVVYRGPDADYQGREICFSSNENVVAVIDVTNKANPTVISEWGYPEVAYTHQGWLTPDQRYFIFGDELDELDGTVDNTTTYIMDALDLDSPKRPKPFAHETRSIDHNLYIQDDLVYASNYGAGLRILQFTDSSLANGQLNEVGFFDIRPGFDEPEFVGTWSNYPFFDSGIVVMTGIEEGSTVLYVLRPTGDAAREGGGGGGQGGGGQGGGGGSGQGDDSQPEDAARGGALSTTGAQVFFFLLLGLALTALGTIILKLSRATRRARAPEVSG
jgi:choice-of-anchor B domain-containing protein